MGEKDDDEAWIAADVVLELEDAVLSLERSQREISNPRQKMHLTIAAMHRVSAAIEEYSKLPIQKMPELVERARLLHRKSPFLQRLQDWPRGYPGDFETIEILCEAKPALTKDDPAYFIEWYALNTAIAQQHRNKIQFQSNLIREFVYKIGKSVIASVGCGGARDFAFLSDKVGCKEVYLVDLDTDALEFASNRLGDRIAHKLIHGDAVRGLRKIDQKCDHSIWRSF